MRKIPFAVRLLLEGTCLMTATVFLMNHEAGRFLVLWVGMLLWGRWKFVREIKRVEQDRRLIEEQSIAEWEHRTRQHQELEQARQRGAWWAFAVAHGQMQAQSQANSLLNMTYAGQYDGRLENQKVTRTDPAPTPQPLKAPPHRQP